jgi:hypothetical protein
VLEACTGPGRGQVAQMMVGFGPDANYSNKTYMEHFGLSRAILFSQGKVTRSCAYLMLVDSHKIKN